MTFAKGLLAWVGDGEIGARWDRSRCAGPDGECAARCTGACPAQALAWREDSIGIGEGCDACGLCAAACPRAALAVAAVIRSMDEARRRKTESCWFCERVPPASRGAGGTRVACLGSIPPEELVRLAVAVNPPVFLQAGPCDACPRGSAYALLKPRLKGLARYLERAAGTPVLVFGERPAGAEEGRSGLSRRAFFVALRGSAAEPALAPPVASEGQLRPGQALPRGVLLKALQRLSGGKPAPEGGASVLPALLLPKVDERDCTLCGRCALLCSAGALSLKASEGRLTLGLEADRCTGCGACAEACAPAALTLHESLDALEGVAGLADAPSKLCLRCGCLFAKRPSPSASTCPSCAASSLRRTEPRFPGYSQPG